MKFSPHLIQATLVKRYKRFLADVILEDGTELTAHCPNTGSMRGCSTPGSAVGLSVADNPKRKYKHTLEIVREGDIWIGVNTARTNHLVAEAILAGQVAQFEDVDSIQKEVKVSASSRLDLAIEQGESISYVEIKNCSLVEDGFAMFPDAVTARGTKHLQELIELRRAGHNSCIFFLVQRMDAEQFRPASHIDPVYSETLGRAHEEGVHVLAYQAKVSLAGIEVVRELPVIL